MKFGQGIALKLSLTTTNQKEKEAFKPKLENLFIALPQGLEPWTL